MTHASRPRFQLIGDSAASRMFRTTVALAAIVCCGSSLSWARSPAPPKSPAPRPETLKLTEDLAALRAELERAGERNHALATAVAEMREAIGRLQQRLGDLEAEGRQEWEAQHHALEQLRELREEVRGLYVESSGLKGDIAQLSDRHETLADEFKGFRLSAGILAALLLLLQLVAVALLLRGMKS